MTILESLSEAVDALEAETDKLRASVDKIPLLSEQVIAQAVAKALAEYAAENPDAPEIPETALVDITRRIHAQTRAINAQGAGIELFYENKLAHDDYHGAQPEPDAPEQP